MLGTLLDLASLVVARVDQNLLPVCAGNWHRLKQVRRHDLHAVVVGLGVIDLRLAALEQCFVPLLASGAPPKLFRPPKLVQRPPKLTQKGV